MRFNFIDIGCSCDAPLRDLDDHAEHGDRVPLMRENRVTSKHANSDNDIRTWSPSDADALETLRGVLALAKRYSATLGFLPNSAFTDRARHGGLIIGTRGGVVLGYTLFDLPRSGHIKLVHVCVADESRGSRLAKRMTDLAIANNPLATGIYAACREDYGIDAFWHALGMSPRHTIPGRALKGSTLVQWWRPLGQLDLFESLLTDSAVPLAVLDSNVVADLFGISAVHRATRSESTGLLASWVSDTITFAVSSQVDTENMRNPNSLERTTRTARSAHLTRIRSLRPDDSTVDDQIREFLGEDALKNDPSLNEDARHLADAINANAEYFITHDAALIDLLRGWVEAKFRMIIARPSEVIQLLASTQPSRRYQSRLIESVDFYWRSASEFTVDELADRFVSSELGERKRSLERLLRELQARVRDVTLEVLVGPKDELVAIVALEPQANELHVPLFRVNGRRTGETLAFQLARWIRVQATGRNLPIVRIALDALNTTTRSALESDGFAPHIGELRAEPRAAIAIREELPRLLGHTSSVTDVIELERRHWPLMIADAELPSYLVPIQPRFAEALFGYQTDALFQLRKSHLGLSREHVYYHAGGNTHIPPGPARLLWYATKDKTSTLRRIVAVSRTVETRTLPAKDAHHAFAHLGTLRRRDVASSANQNGMVHVIRFEDSILIPTPLPREDLQALLRKHNINEPLQSLRRVPRDFFTEIVRSSQNGDGL